MLREEKTINAKIISARLIVRCKNISISIHDSNKEKNAVIESHGNIDIDVLYGAAGTVINMEGLEPSVYVSLALPKKLRYDLEIYAGESGFSMVMNNSGYIGSALVKLKNCCGRHFASYAEFYGICPADSMLIQSEGNNGVSYKMMSIQNNSVEIESDSELNIAPIGDIVRYKALKPLKRGKTYQKSTDVKMVFESTPFQGNIIGGLTGRQGVCMLHAMSNDLNVPSFCT